MRPPRRAIGGQLDEQAHELRDGEPVSRREVEHPILLAGREPHVYPIAASANRRSSSSRQMLGGRLPPKGAWRPPQRRPTGAATRRHKAAPTATRALTRDAADPSPMREPCVYDIGSWLLFGLYQETVRKRAIFGRQLTIDVAYRPPSIRQIRPVSRIFALDVNQL